MGEPVRNCQNVVISGVRKINPCVIDKVKCTPEPSAFRVRVSKCAEGDDNKQALAELNKVLAGICREGNGVENCSYRREGGVKTEKVVSVWTRFKNALASTNGRFHEEKQVPER